MSRDVIRRLWGGSFVRWCSLKADGASGEILLLWETKIYYYFIFK